MSNDPLMNISNLAYVEELYASYLRDPGSVSAEWQATFQAMPDDPFTSNPALEPAAAPSSIFNPPSNGQSTEASHPNGLANGYSNGAMRSDAPSARPAESDVLAASLQERLIRLVRSYRVRGHLIAKLDPLGIPRPPQPELFPAFYGFTDEDLDRTFPGDCVHAMETLTLRQIVARLRRTYCENIGVQYMHIDDLVMKQWLEERMEITENKIVLTHSQQLKTLTKLTDAVLFEEFIQKKFMGSKSFSLEGSESIIPLLTQALEIASDDGMEEIVIAMAHRGRLNVLANIMGKNPRQIFTEFADKDPLALLGRGDVKYHLGYSSDLVSPNGHSMHLSLCFNPSHLEFVNPVAMGRTRAKQDRRQDFDRRRMLCIQIHGDSAFAGEGVVQETLNLSELDGYRTGGTLHVIINNQIGFTTTAAQGRSCTYATDVGKMLQIPIFHVNGEHPEAVAQVVRLAMEFRRTFDKDVIIDMYSYRRRGHNETDEPAFTQPMMYRAIKKRPKVREGYLQNLLKPGGVTQEEADRIEEERRQHLEAELQAAKQSEGKLKADAMGGIWHGYTGGPHKNEYEVNTGLPLEQLKDLLLAQTQMPAGFTPHPKIVRWLDARREMAQGNKKLDWGAAEALAFASLLKGGTRIRITGQDSERGTFSHRHSVLHDCETGKTHTPLQHLSPEQGYFEVHNSPLCETAVLGFEYGYSLDMPDSMVIWEAQFGDFFNVAQVIMDQFISSGEDKWQRLCGLVMLLPHAFEGMGPEHSSARLERFLALAAEDNVQIVYPSTPAQCFHMMRRQHLRPWRKPLVVMSPKSLLRHPGATSTLDELANGRFQNIIDDERPVNNASNTKRVLICSGKIYYELIELREKSGRDDIAVIRLEQLYPLDTAGLEKTLSVYADGTPVFYVQDDPENMGAWRFLRIKLGDKIFGRFPFDGISRPEAASPATGSASSHRLEQARLLSRALELEEPSI